MPIVSKNKNLNVLMQVLLKEANGSRIYMAIKLGDATNRLYFSETF